MKKSISAALAVIFMLATAGNAWSQQTKAVEKFKKYINKVVQEVEEAELPAQKRDILNRSFDRLITAFERVEQMEQVPEPDRNAIADLRETITEKKKELNGRGGYERVPGRQLDAFAHYVQQDLEQADEVVTISLTTLLLILIILLLI